MRKVGYCGLELGIYKVCFNLGKSIFWVMNWREIESTYVVYQRLDGKDKDNSQPQKGIPSYIQVEMYKDREE